MKNFGKVKSMAKKKKCKRIRVRLIGVDFVMRSLVCIDKNGRKILFEVSYYELLVYDNKLFNGSELWLDIPLEPIVNYF